MEITRNSAKRSGIYRDELANRKYAKCQKEKHKDNKFTAQIQNKVEYLLREDYRTVYKGGRNKVK